MYDKLAGFLGPSKLKMFVLVYTLRAVKWQIVCNNQDTAPVQNIYPVMCVCFYLENTRLGKIL
jgi:hypothetical protein